MGKRPTPLPGQLGLGAYGFTSSSRLLDRPCILPPPPSPPAKRKEPEPEQAAAAAEEPEPSSKRAKIVEQLAVTVRLITLRTPLYETVRLELTCHDDIDQPAAEPGHYLKWTAAQKDWAMQKVDSFLRGSGCGAGRSGATPRPRPRQLQPGLRVRRRRRASLRCPSAGAPAC